MARFASIMLACALTFLSARANAQAGATPPVAEAQPAQNPPTADDICRAVEEDAAENGLPVEFFARIIWQASRFNALDVSRKAAAGIAQFMRRTADWHGLADPFNPIEALKHSASYLRELRDRFGNLGLAAAGYNAGPGRVSEWLPRTPAPPGGDRNHLPAPPRR